jgi:alkylation response protein AidB-like acyl-CoA dehydrogenase
LLLNEFATAEQKQKHLTSIADGAAAFTLAWTEQSGEYGPGLLRTSIAGHGGALTLTGAKYFVPSGSQATHYLVVASGPDRKTVLAIVPRQQPAVAVRALSTTGRDNQAVVEFKQTPVSPGDLLPGDGAAILERALQLGAAMQCLYMSGMAQRALEITRDYAKVRVQFGRPIGSFQAVQHHLANMAADTDISRNLAYRLAERIAAGQDVAFEASAAKAWCAPACMRVMQTGHQVHGGIGVITDHAMQMYFLRMKPFEVLLGDADFHTKRVGARLMDLVA